ncbi:fosfomycin resistance glutathione transferase [Acidovorax sp. CCYZU-2555]|uniref:fosfomycin resistance glutathione transferase n=1 Tax=Acidovorax sp. CCYZU-2555 TaxID=2835042 RepID=UPI001BCD7879|nr:fosfomycin resistance glutathione transferase [Acidovorax sp. CCYZU-2555]MBS7779912.1 fosfomycin resistance glutathione transferase [Acidovorax sp. CCYZU-2555]
MLTGINHLTLAVESLERSVVFYQDRLGFTLAARWKTGAYLELGSLWLCLSVDASRSPLPLPEYTHYAFSISQADFGAFVARLRGLGVPEWKINGSEGDSFYFLDPDGHKLEAHVGSLASRLAKCRAQPYADMEFFDAKAQ